MKSSESCHVLWHTLGGTHVYRLCPMLLLSEWRDQNESAVVQEPCVPWHSYLCHILPLSVIFSAADGELVAQLAIQCVCCQSCGMQLLPDIVGKTIAYEVLLCDCVQHHCHTECHHHVVVHHARFNTVLTLSCCSPAMVDEFSLLLNILDRILNSLLDSYPFADS